MQNPLLLTNSGIIWLNSVYNKKNQTISKNIEILKKSRKKMMNVWEGNNWIQGEKHNLYLKKIIYTLDKKIESKICNVAKKWILPILKHIK